MSSAPLHGLLLAGGRSTRMHRDKAALQYHGRSQLDAAWDLLAAVTEQTYVSVRADQIDEPLRRRYPQIVDGEQGQGPLAGILAAQRRQPTAAWLVLACDLPRLDEPSLRHLVAQRDPTAPATAYRSSHDGLPEPLCAIFEPAAAAALRAYAARGRHCPRKFLLEQPTKLLEPLVADALDNINSTAEYWQAMQSLASAAVAPRRLRVQYFALLREQAGRSEESLESTAQTPADLYAELQTRHGFSLPTSMLKVAVNGEFGDWAQPLQAGDAVVFIPPVAGG